MSRKKLWSDKKTLRGNLQGRLPDLASRWIEEGRAALAPGTGWDELHRFRLATKRFRYTLELFRPVYGRGLEERLSALREVQTYLGDINDAVVTAALIGQVDGAQAARQRLDRRAAAKTRALRSYWKRSFDDAGTEGKWVEYLARPGTPANAGSDARP